MMPQHLTYRTRQTQDDQQNRALPTVIAQRVLYHGTSIRYLERQVARYGYYRHDSEQVMLTGSACEAMLSALCRAKRTEDLGIILLVDRDKANGNIRQGVKNYLAGRVDTDSYLAYPVVLDEDAADGLEATEQLLKGYRKEQLARINHASPTYSYR